MPDDGNESTLSLDRERGIDVFRLELSGDKKANILLVFLKLLEENFPSIKPEKKKSPRILVIKFNEAYNYDKQNKTQNEQDKTQDELLEELIKGDLKGLVDAIVFCYLDKKYDTYFILDGNNPNCEEIEKLIKKKTRLISRIISRIRKFFL